jgi:peptide/nickel transport system ATP-binding protein
MTAPLLQVRDLTIDFRTRGGIVQALEGVNLGLGAGETLGIVGESGSGKSVTAFAVMGLLDAAAKIRSGTIQFGGKDLLGASTSELQRLRGRDMALIFQDARAALNPTRAIGRQLEDVFRAHQGLGSRERRDAALAALARVRIPDPERRYAAYPFELSGGMCQRVMIALALACAPRLLIADEPTTGLDVTTQAAVMDLIQDLGRDSGTATILITHDLALAGEYCDRLAVMHAGHVVEAGSTARVMARPAHPYTARLIGATPTATAALADLQAIPGQLPDLRGELPPCRFSGRCPQKVDACDTPRLTLAAVAAGRLTEHAVACRRPLA